MADDAKQPETSEAPPASETPPAEEPSASEPASEAEEELTLDEAAAWKGSKLDDLSGSTVGKVEGVYVDEDGGRPEWLMARMGLFGHHCLIPARDAVAAGGHVWVPYSRDQVRKAPRIDPGKPLERERETELLEHYGVGSADAGRGAELATRDAGAVTSRPA